MDVYVSVRWSSGQFLAEVRERSQYGNIVARFVDSEETKAVQLAIDWAVSGECNVKQLAYDFGYGVGCSA